MAHLATKRLNTSYIPPLCEYNASYNLPSSNNISTISNIRPNKPPGQYPHPLLCGHAGNAPISASIKTMIRIVPNIYPPRCSEVCHLIIVACIVISTLLI
jgi:hypothetical protein